MERVFPRRLAVVALLGVVGAVVSGCLVWPWEEPFVVPKQDEEGRYVIVVVSGEFKFDPKNAVVPVGGTVWWENDGGRHNVVARNVTFSSGHPTEFRRAGGYELNVTWELLGDHPYVCGPHSPDMRGVLRVVTEEELHEYRRQR